MSASTNASAASQAVGPLLSDFEMSCTGRAFADIGRKMMAQQALKLQAVMSRTACSACGGPVGDIVAASRIGLKHTYGEMIKQGFAKRFWATPDSYKFVTNDDGTASLVTDPPATRRWS